MDITEEKINQVITELKKKASEDEDFRKLCLDNPNEAIKQVFGIDIPEGIKINIIQDEPGVAHTIILPRKLGVLNDEELDRLAGGGRICSGYCVSQGPCPFQ